MFVFANLLVAAAKVLSLALSIYMWIIIARAVLSWVSPDPYNPIVRFLYQATDPVLDRLRRFLPLQFGGVDLTPVALLLALYVVKDLLLNLIARLALG